MRKNNKGFALVEMLMGLALIAMVLPLIYYLYIFGLETFTNNNRLIAQQYAVTNTISHIKGDVQSAASVDTASENTEEDKADVYPKVITLKLGYINGVSATVNQYKYWRFYCASPGVPGVLQYSGVVDASHIITDSDYSDVVTGLDISDCCFKRSGDKLVVQVKPHETNSGRAQTRNIREPVKTEMSVLYKD